MKKMITVLLSVFLLLSLFSLFSCEESEVLTLYVYNWGEYISDGTEDTLDVNLAFEEYCREELGLEVKVNYSTFSSNEDMYAKISSGSAVYDVLIPSDYMIERMVNEDLLQPLDLALIPNYENILDAYKGDNIYYECGREELYSVPYMCGMIGVIYNTDIVKEEDVSDKSWNLMWNETYAGDILQYNNPRDAFGVALYSLGYSVNTTSEAEWTEALEKLKAQKDVVQGYVMDEIFNKMSSGSAAIASYYAGDYLNMYLDNESLAFYYPTEGTNIYVDAMCIPKSSHNQELANRYINFMCSEEIAVANAEYILYASPVQSVLDSEEYQTYLSEEVKDDAYEILYGTEAELARENAEPYYNLDDEGLARMNDLWEELKVESTMGPVIYVLCILILSCLLALLVCHILKKRRWAKLYD